MAAKKKKKTGLPKKYAKMGFAKGWAAYKKAKRAAAAKRKKSVKKKATPKKTAKKKTAKKKATKKKTTKKKATTKKVTKKKSNKSAPKKKPAKKKGKGTMAKKSVSLLSPKMVNVIASSGSATTGLLVGTGAVNFLPYIKDQKAWIKALVQAITGLSGFALIKNKYWKMGFLGTTLGAAYTALAPYLPEQMKLAGRDFSQAEIQELMTLGIIDPATDIGGYANGLGVVDEESEMTTMGKGRYTSAIDVY